MSETDARRERGLRLDGKTAIVTGAGRGLGRAMALALAQAGARVVAVDLILENLTRVEREAEAQAEAGLLLALEGDVRQSQDCRRAIDMARERFGGVDILVNNAGLLPNHVYPGRLLEGAPPARFWNLDDDIVQDVMDTNYVAHDRMTRLAVPDMIDKGWGRVINVTTRLSTINRTGGSPYGASKAALEMASEIWAKDLAGTGVTVNILNPGAAVDTPGFASPEEKRAATAAGRLHMMHPDKMQAPIVWLASAATDGVSAMRYDAVAWDPARPPEEQAAIHGRPLGFLLKPKTSGDEQEVRDDRRAIGTEAKFNPEN